MLSVTFRVLYIFFRSVLFALLNSGRSFSASIVISLIEDMICWYTSGCFENVKTGLRLDVTGGVELIACLVRCPLMLSNTSFEILKISKKMWISIHFEKIFFWKIKKKFEGDSPKTKIRKLKIASPALIDGPFSNSGERWWKVRLLKFARIRAEVNGSEPTRTL